MPLQWSHTKYPDPNALDGYLEQNDMSDLPQDLTGFRAFFDARRERLGNGSSKCWAENQVRWLSH